MGSFICTILMTGYHIPRRSLHQSRSTRWNEKCVVAAVKHPPSQIILGVMSCLDTVGQYFIPPRARCSSVVRAFDHGAMGRRIDPSWGGPIELFLVPASAPRLVVSCLWDGAYKITLAVNLLLTTLLFSTNDDWKAIIICIKQRNTKK